MLQNAGTPFEQGQAEVELSWQFLRFASDMKSGMLVPREANRTSFRDRAEHDRLDLIQGFPGGAGGVPARPCAAVAGYARLVRERLRLEAIREQVGGGLKLRPGGSSRGWRVPRSWRCATG